MAEWILNRVTLHGAEQKEIEKVKDFMESEDFMVDFNNILPVPEDLDNINPKFDGTYMVSAALGYYLACEFGDYEGVDKFLTYEWVKQEGVRSREDFFVYLLGENPDLYNFGKEIYRLDQVYGCHTVHEWKYKNWGTDWMPMEEKLMGNVISFVTGWRGVPKLFRILSKKFPKVTIDYEYADEAFGIQTARYTFVAGNIMAEYKPEDYSIEAKQLSLSIYASAWM